MTQDLGDQSKRDSGHASTVLQIAAVAATTAAAWGNSVSLPRTMLLPGGGSLWELVWAALGLPTETVLLAPISLVNLAIVLFYRARVGSAPIVILAIYAGVMTATYALRVMGV